ncbi:YesL family protein [Niallia sp. FSL R7-0271]|uniref:YesL family protein n=1 Tax=Niallia sp. FSL R7-0271 TaxID=2921678 RepID=UPI0030F9C11A
MNIIDSKFYGVIDKLSNLFILNLFWLLSCIPIITIAPATSAMYSVVRQWKVNEDNSVVRNYFHYFKENFKQSISIGAIVAVLLSILFFNFFYLNQDATFMKIVMTVPLLLVSFLFLATFFYIFPLISHYRLPIKAALRNSLLLSMMNIHITILILAMFGLCSVILFYIPFTGIILFSTAALLHYSLCHKVFARMDETKILS